MKNRLSLIFDIDDTLYRQLVPLQAACEEALGGKIPVDAEEFYRIFCRRSGEMFLASESGDISIHQSRLYRISNTMKDLGIPFTEEMAEVFQAKYAENQAGLRLPDTLSRMLEDCRNEGISMGIITNGPDGHQRKKYHNMGLGRWIPEEFLLISGSAGCAKPDVNIFRMEEKQMGCSRENTYMIGDSYENDMAGAMRAGWKTIWVNYHRYPLPQGAERPEHIVYSEEELKNTVERLIRKKAGEENKK